MTQAQVEEVARGLIAVLGRAMICVMGSADRDQLRVAALGARRRRVRLLRRLRCRSLLWHRVMADDRPGASVERRPALSSSWSAAGCLWASGSPCFADVAAARPAAIRDGPLRRAQPTRRLVRRGASRSYLLGFAAGHAGRPLDDGGT